jgi:cytochrome oxidase assembly protein ShyY1
MYVVTQALQTLAVIVKRGWIPEEDKENFPGPVQQSIFNQISQLLAGEPQYVRIII